MDVNAMNHAERRAEKKKRKMMRGILNGTANSKHKVENVDQTNKHLEICTNGKGCIMAEIGTSLAINSTAQSLSEEQRKVDTVLTEIPVEKSAVDQSMVNSVSAEILEKKSASSKKKRRRVRRKAKNRYELQNMDQTNKFLEIPRNEISCITAEMGTFLDANSTAQPLSLEQSKVDTVSTEILEEKSGMDKLKEDTASTEILTENRSTKKKKIRKLKCRGINNELEKVDPTDQYLEISNNGKGCVTAQECTLPAVNSTKQSLPHVQSKVDMASTEIPVEKSPVNQPKLHTFSADILEEKSASSKKKRRKPRREAKNCNNGQNCPIAEMGSSRDVNLAAHPVSLEQSKVDRVSTVILEGKSGMDKLKEDTVSTEILAENTSTKKKKIRKLKCKGISKDELEKVNPTDQCLEISNNGKGCITAEVCTLSAVNSTKHPLPHMQSKVDMVSTEIPVEKSPVNQPNLHTFSADIIEEKSANSKKKRRKPRREAKNCNNGQNCPIAEMGSSLDVNLAAHPVSLEQSKVDTVSTVILEGKSGMDKLKEDTVSTEILAENSSTEKKKIRKLKCRGTNKNELEKVDPTDKYLEISNNGKGCIIAKICTVPSVNSTKHSLSHMQSKVDMVSTEITVEKSPVNQPKVHTCSADILEEKSASSKKKRRKPRREAKNCNKGQNCTTADVCSSFDVNLAAISLSQELLKVDAVSTENLLEKSAMEQPKWDAVSVEMPVEKSVIGKQKIQGLRGRTSNKDEVAIMDPKNKHLVISDNGQCCNIAEMGAFFGRNSTSQSLSQDQVGIGIVSAENVVDTSETRKRKRNRKKKMEKKVHDIDGCPSMDLGDTFSNVSLLNECNKQVTCNENVADKCRSETKCPSEHTSSAVTEDKLSKHSCLLPKTAPVTRRRKILLILDLNGLLADIVMPPPKGHKADTCVMRRAIFKRPHCDDFLKFCFEMFDVGIWSSRCKRVIDRVVACLLNDLQDKLLFCWDMTHTTKTKFKTLDNKHKLLVCKELRKLWERHSPKLPWEKGDYDESNTLLIDDSPYKALLNPVGTAIFPHSYSFKDQNDKALGPGGDLRLYLQDLAKTDNVQKYVEQHPFGKSPINDKSPDWSFYSKVLESLSHR